MKYLILVTVFFITSTLFAGEEYEQYQGQFIKKSIAITDLIDMRKGKTTSLKSYKSVHKKIRHNLHLKRFDINHIEYTSEHTNFIRSIEAAKKRRMNTNRIIANNISKYLGQKVLEITKDSSEIRAKQMITDAQSSSMLATKAKEDFVYESQILVKANTSYMFVPAVNKFSMYKAADSVSRRNISARDYRKGYRVFYSEGDYSISVYKIERLKNNRRSVKQIKRLYRSVSNNSIQRKDKAYGKMFSQFVVSIPGDIVASNVRNDIEEINDFLLTEQITLAQKGEVWFPLGEEVGVSVDDKFWHTTFNETSKGIVEQKNGWVIVKEKGTKKNKGVSKAHVIKGNPDNGDIVKEIPMLGVATNLGATTEPVSADQPNLDGNIISSFEMGNSVLFDVGSKVLIGSKMGVSQLYLTMDFAIGGGSAGGEAMHVVNRDTLSSTLDGYFNTSFKFGVDKKFYFSRLAIVPGVQFNFRSIDINASSVTLDLPYEFDNSGDSETYLYWTYETVGLNFNTMFEYAISPKLNIGGSVTYFLNTPTEMLNLYASSESLSPTLVSIANVFKSMTGGDDLAGNDRVEFFNQNYENVDISNSGFAFSLYISKEF